MKPQKVPTPLALTGTRSELLYEPKGVVLIIGPWNYPFQLVFTPLMAALAAGNTCVLKPSELTPATTAWIRDLVKSTFSDEEVAVVEGDAEVTQQLLELPWDHIFFTGSPKVGKVVMAAAAKHLTPVTLELGGKSPVVIDESADLNAAAERIAWGKWVNAGQTCIAPDYVLVPEELVDPLVRQMRVVIEGFYGKSEAERKASQDFARIINDRNFSRLQSLLADAMKKGALVSVGGQVDAQEKYIAPTVLTQVPWDCDLMKEEIFGPILPVLGYRNLEDALAKIRTFEKPLALYVFSKDERASRRILSETTAGGSAVNNTLIHLANHELPFGGVGPSGHGSYHGFFGFKAFSHERAVIFQGGINPYRMFFPPYTEKVKKIVALATKYLA